MKNVLYLPWYDEKYPYVAIGQRLHDGTLIGFLHYFSHTYRKTVQAQCPYRSDGATWAPDIDSDCWWFHDILCDTGHWADNELCTNWQASTVLFDIMRSEGRNWFRCHRWKHATFLFGGGKARDNGMFRVK